MQAKVVFAIALSVVALGSFMVQAIPEGTVLDPTVELSHCAYFGGANGFFFEWELKQVPKDTLEMRFTADIQREKFSAFGFTQNDKTQIVSGYPTENIACARTLFDNNSPFDVNGNVYPNHPELPGNLVTSNDTHAIHYMMRNLSVTARHMREEGHTLTVNMTILWSYMQASLFKSGCYGGDVSKYSEYATFNLPLASSDYEKQSDGSCLKYSGRVTPHRMNSVIDPTTDLLDREQNQNRRLAVLLMGGELLLESGAQEPVYDYVDGRILGGEGGNGVCQQSLTVIYARWSGFSDHVGGIQEYLVSLGTTALPSLYVDRISAGTNEALEYYYSDGLTPNTTLIVTVTANNSAGLTTAVSSKEVRVLNGGKSVYGWINDGPSGADAITYQQSLSQLDAHWGGFDRKEFSTINHDTGVVTGNSAEYAVGTGGDDGLEDVVAWTTIAGVFATEVSITSGWLKTLTHATTYYVSVRAKSCSTQYTVMTTTGVTLDSAPPKPGVIRYGNVSQPHVHHTTAHSAELLTGRWEGFTDDVAGISHYFWAIGTVTPCPDVSSTGAGFVLPWTNVGEGTSFLANRMYTYPGLASGTTFYIYVKAVDAVGNFMVATSNATTVLEN